MNPAELIEEQVVEAHLFESRVAPTFSIATKQDGISDFPDTATYQIATRILRSRNGEDHGMLFVSRNADMPFTELSMVMSGRPAPEMFPVDMISRVSVHVEPGKFI